MGERAVTSETVQQREERWRGQERRRPTHWPRHVIPYSLDDDLLGFDRRGNLYWDGQQLQIASKLSLTRFQAFVASVAAASALAIAIVEVARFLGY